MKYQYTIIDENGKKIKGIIEANDINEVKSLLKDKIILDIKEKKHFEINLSKKVKKSELFRLFNTLGLYLKASIPVLTAIKLTKNQTSSNKIIKFLDVIEKEIKEGKSFFSAISSQKIIKIPGYVISAVKVAENSGKLDVVLIEMAKFLKDEEKVERKTKQALIYPSFILIVSVLIVSFMLTTVVPKIVNVFSNLNQKLPSTTEFVINAGNFLKHNYLTIIVIFILTVLFFSLLYKKIYKFKYMIDSILLKIPLINKIIITSSLSKFSYLVYTLTSSGVTFVTAINLAISTFNNAKLKHIFSLALDEVVEGKKLSTSLQRKGFTYDKSFLQALALAEETSEIDNILKNVSELYFEENESRINTLLSLLEPMLMIIVGGVIGFIVTALLLPLFNINFIK